MSDDEFDDIPDAFAHVHDVDWTQLLGSSHLATVRSGSNTPPPLEPAEIPPVASTANITVPDSTDSSLYFSDDGEMDASFFAELNRLEETLVQAESMAPSASIPVQSTNNAAPWPSSSEQNSGTLAPQPRSHEISGQQRLHPRNTLVSSELNDSFSIDKNSKREGERAANISNKRPRLGEPSQSDISRNKGKGKADDTLQQILFNYDDELTCPICCDLFVASHVGNPCGHNFCGDCGWRWYLNIENKNKGCPCCRATLDGAVPMIPNISMDNVVDKHIQSLALSGMLEWAPSGQNYKEWNVRKAAWRESAKKRVQSKRKPPQQRRSIISLGTIHVFDAPEAWVQQVEDDLEEDPTYEEGSDIELVPPPRHATRWRRGRPRA